MLEYFFKLKLFAQKMEDYWNTEAPSKIGALSPCNPIFYLEADCTDVPQAKDYTVFISKKVLFFRI